MSSRPHLPCLQAAKPLVQHLRSLLYFSLVIFSFSQFPLPPSSRIRSLILVSFITHPFDSFSLYQGQKNQTEERRGEGRGSPLNPSPSILFLVDLVLPFCKLSFFVLFTIKSYQQPPVHLLHSNWIENLVSSLSSRFVRSLMNLSSPDLLIRGGNVHKWLPTFSNLSSCSTLKAESVLTKESLQLGVPEVCKWAIVQSLASARMPWILRAALTFSRSRTE